MRKRLAKFAGIFLTVALTAGLIAGCGGGNDSNSGGGETGNAETQAAGGNENTSGGDAGGFKFAGDIVGQGGEALDIIVAEEEFVFGALGSSFQIYNDNFTADTQGTNIQTMASAGYDGMMIFGWNATLYSTISDAAKSAEVPFVMFDQIPTEESMISQLEENEYYVGSVGVDNFKAGENIANKMLADGITTSLILGGAVGDVVHDSRAAGFTETFEAGGGTVLGSARCADPSEGTAKEDDLISGNPDAQATYCLTGDFAIAALAALENHSGTEMSIYCSDTTSEVIPHILDGSVVSGDGGSKIATTLAATLLQNYAEGNIIKDENGKAPNFNTIVPFEINGENAELYKEMFLTGHPLTEESVQALVGPDVTYQNYVDFITDFSWEKIANQ